MYHRLILPIIVLISLILALSGTAVQAQAPLTDGAKRDAPTTGAEALSETEWTDIKYQIQEAVYHLTPLRLTEGKMGYQAPNPANDLELIFHQTGLTARPNQPQRERYRAMDPTDLHTRAWDWTLSLQGYGYETTIQPITKPMIQNVNKHRIEYVYDLDPQSKIIEWYENREAGVKHGFTLNAPPMRGSGMVVLRLHLQTPLQMTLAPGGQALYFQDDQGQTVLKYDSLYVYDANRQPVPAQLTLDHTHPDHINIVIDDQHASYPLTVDPLLTNQFKKLTASDGTDFHFFGVSVAIKNDTLLIGASGDSNNQGAAYLFERNQGGLDNWGQVKKLTADDGVADDFFGASVAISGDSLLIGASGDENDQGAVYLFERNQGGSDNWGQVKKIIANDGAADDNFGISAAIKNDTLLIGAWQDNSNRGAAYLFKRNQGGVDNWGQVKKITADDGAADDNFGRSVAMSDDTLLVGAYKDNSEQGAAYLFKRNQGGADNWGQVKKITADDGVTDDEFGVFVAINNETLLIGARGDENDQGAAYLFKRNQGGADNWGQVKKIIANDGAAGDSFGTSVAIDNDTLLIGAWQDDISRGAAYLFERNQGGADNWGQVKKIIANNGSINFGSSVAISGDTLLVGSFGNDSWRGAAYTFIRQGNSWQQIQKPIASDGEAHDHFGFSVAIDGDTLLVGAFADDAHSGAAYLFERNQGGSDNWGQIKKLTASDRELRDQFGNSVAIDGDTLVIGAFTYDHRSGAVYLFERNQGGSDNWGQIKKITLPLPSLSRLGISVAIKGDTLLIGADGDANSQGAVYLFERNQGGADNWGQIKKITIPDGVPFENFGRSLVIKGDTLFIGALADDKQGAVYLFERNQGGADNWGQIKKIIADDGEIGDNFGKSVAIDGDTLLVGAYRDDNYQGSAYLFKRNRGGSDNWGQVKKFTADDGAPDDWFGWSVAIDGDTIIIGAQGDDDKTYNAGAAYLFERNQDGPDNWGQVKKFTASDWAADDNFGVSVTISGDTIIIGAFNDDNDQGAVYLFEWQAIPILSLNKTVDVSDPEVGQVVTYTFGLKNSGIVSATHSVLSDTLPNGLTFAGPVVIEGTTGITGTPPHIASGLTISVGQQITVTMPVQVNEGTEGQIITNTASIVSSEITAPVTNSTSIKVRLAETYLPAILKN